MSSRPWDSVTQLNVFKDDLEKVVKGLKTIEDLATKYKKYPKAIEFINKNKESKTELRKAGKDAQPSIFTSAVAHKNFMEALLVINASLSDKNLKFYENLKK